MTKATHALRLSIALFAAMGLAACTQSEVESSDKSAADPGHASGEHGSSSSAGLPAGRVAAGEHLAAAKGKATGQSCIDCHGADGNNPIDPTYPKLGGQYGDYLAHALQAYRASTRDHMLMTPQAQKLSDQDIADLAAYFGSRPSQLRDLHGVD
ncbi:cytochrome C biogenesis protein CcsA [Stenotrophomonas terrae]|uniref:Cytochrome C biogenesis protein CcsA n=1 Tax=Stenotrophomonas terrae TaxID=405446 RepID=A0A0R0CSL6_9GAMM|nr:cytochrome c [Stenotrophomonas terrae]KRG67800.1 cytochrome C biogenesis protein CcsA [Stenotrophomonas terrae]